MFDCKIGLVQSNYLSCHLDFRNYYRTNLLRCRNQFMLFLTRIRSSWWLGIIMAKFVRFFGRQNLKHLASPVKWCMFSLDGLAKTWI